MLSNNMSDSERFILLAIAFLIPVSVFIGNWILLLVGKYFWKWYLPKLRRNSKLRFRVIEMRKTDESFLYVETGIGILFFIFLGIAGIIYLF